MCSRWYVGMCNVSYLPLHCLTCLLHTQPFSRVYRGVWKGPSSDGTAQSVVVKVLSPPQAKREIEVLSALAPHPSARAVRMLGTVRVGMDTGIITPYCPGQLFEGCSVEAVLEQVMQLCEVGLVHELSAYYMLTVGRVGTCRLSMAGTPMGCSTWT